MNDPNLDRCRTRIAELAAIKDGWHDGGGLAPTSKAVSGALRFLSLRPAMPPDCGVYPTDDGGLLFEFTHEGWDYSVEVMPSGTVEIFSVQLHGPGEADAALDRPPA